MRRRTIVDELMAEIVNYGGVAMPRETAYRYAIKHCSARLAADEPNRDQRLHRAANLFAFGSHAKALTPDEAARLIPLDVAEANGLLR